MSSRLALTVISAAALLSVSTADAAPDQLCVPEPAGAEPAWWNPGLSAKQKEARWSGAAVRKLAKPGHSSRVRALYSPAGETVYFELKVTGDPSLQADQDAVIVALGDETGTHPELYLRVRPFLSCAAPADCDGAGAALDAAAIEYSGATFSGLSITWSDLSPDNPSGAFFVEHPWVTVVDEGETYGWTVSFALVVPVTAGGEIRPDLRIYGNHVVYEPTFTSGTYVELPTLCTSSSMISNDCEIYAGLTPELPFDLPLGNLEDSWSVLRSDCAPLHVL